MTLWRFFINGVQKNFNFFKSEFILLIKNKNMEVIHWKFYSTYNFRNVNTYVIGLFIVVFVFFFFQKSMTPRWVDIATLTRLNREFRHQEYRTFNSSRLNNWTTLTTIMSIDLLGNCSCSRICCFARCFLARLYSINNIDGVN